MAGRGNALAGIPAELRRFAPPNLRATGYGLFNCAACLAGGIISAAAGALKATVGLGVSFQVTGIVLFASALLLLRLRVTAPQQS